MGHNRRTVRLFIQPCLHESLAGLLQSQAVPIALAFSQKQGRKHVLWSVWFRLVWLADSRTAQFSPGCGSSPGVLESHPWWGDSYQAPAPAASHAHTCCCSGEESHHQWLVHSEISSKTERQTINNIPQSYVIQASGHQKSSSISFSPMAKQLQIIHWKSSRVKKEAPLLNKRLYLILTLLQNKLSPKTSLAKPSGPFVLYECGNSFPIVPHSAKSTVPETTLNYDWEHRAIEDYLLRRYCFTAAMFLYIYQNQACAGLHNQNGLICQIMISKKKPSHEHLAPQAVTRSNKHLI